MTQANRLSEIELRTVWRQDDAAIKADVKALWRRLSILPGGVDAETRADEIVCAAYCDGVLAGVSTAFIRELEFLRQRFAMLRGVVAPEFRRQHLGGRLLVQSRDVLERWSREQPGERVMGVAAVVQSPNLLSKPRKAVSPLGGFVLVGYTQQGEQIRVAWFDHAYV